MHTVPRTSVIYLSYDGAAEPLGQSQVVAYLERLASGADIHLVSFEKEGVDVATAARLSRAGVRWHPRRYRKSPPVLSTGLDIAVGTKAIEDVAEEIDGPLIVHVRSYVPALMAVRSKLLKRPDVKLLFDIRGFWADERIEGGIWRRGPLYHYAKWWERRFFSRCDAVVTLTAASVPQIRKWLGGRNVPVAVIPTCADLEKFEPKPRDRAPKLVWCGSVGTWYRFDLAVAIAEKMGLEFDVMTRQIDEAAAVLGDRLPTVPRSVAPHQVPDQLQAGDVGLCLVRPSFSKTASAPTRAAEHLASGNLLVALAGVGDIDRIIEEDRVGVVLDGDTSSDVAEACRAIRHLMADPDTPARCRRSAEQRFGLRKGVEDYGALYERLVEG